MPVEEILLYRYCYEQFDSIFCIYFTIYHIFAGEERERTHPETVTGWRTRWALQEPRNLSWRRSGTSWMSRSRWCSRRMRNSRRRTRISRDRGTNWRTRKTTSPRTRSDRSRRTTDGKENLDSLSVRAHWVSINACACPLIVWSDHCGASCLLFV